MADDTIQTSVRLSPANHEWLRRTAFDRTAPGRKVSQNDILNELIDEKRDGSQAAGHAFVRPGQVTASLTPRDACMACGRPASDHDSEPQEITR